MSEKLPGIYANKIEKDLNNTQIVYYGKNNNEERKDTLSIESKINRIFNSSDYVYKKEVLLDLDNETVRKTIIGKTYKGLLTMDNEVIEISKIRDIRVV